MRRGPRVLCVLIAGLVLTTAAWAQSDVEVEQEAGDPRDRISPTGPWAEGITPEIKQAANALLREGNILMRDAFFSQAAIKYREAIAIWDHPAFHLNLAMAQRALDQPIEAYHSLDRAMRHGPAALGQITAVEACDSGGVDTASCDADCTLPACGDGYRNSAAGEECDPGETVSSCTSPTRCDSISCRCTL